VRKGRLFVFGPQSNGGSINKYLKISTLEDIFSPGATAGLRAYLLLDNGAVTLGKVNPGKEVWYPRKRENQARFDQVPTPLFERRRK
jgi:hypothetical protein